MRSKKEFFHQEGCFILELHNTPDDPDLSVARVRVLPGETTQWHHLKATQERYLILSGTGIAEKENEDPVQLKVDDIFDIPTGQKQRIHNPGPDELIFLAICTPRFQDKNYVEN